jgi:hypothetical protein
MAKSTPDFEDFTGLSIGDWIAVTGVVMMTRHGEQLDTTSRVLE